MNGLIQDINEHCNVAFLKFKREAELEGSISESTMEIVKSSFAAGYKTAMLTALKMRLGLDCEK